MAATFSRTTSAQSSPCKEELKITIYEMTDSELLDAYKKADTYELEMCAELCKRAGMSAEWEAADVDNFEDVLDAAIDVLEAA